MKLKQVFQILLLIVVFTSCKTPKLTYMEDMESNTSQIIAHPSEIRVQPLDKISIIVNSKDPMLSSLFNLPYVSQKLGQSFSSMGASTSSSSGNGISGYTINNEGDIDFPVLGKVHVNGMNRTEIAAHIKEKLVSNDLVKDPVVTVEFMNLAVSVLGEVNEPGRYNIDKDCFTLLDAISMAGDLTVYGKRNNILVQRMNGDELHSYRVDLTSGVALYKSPVYYLQQNDVVYVEPSEVRARQATVNANNVRSTSFWMSLASLLTTIVVLFVK